jgi:23S rRNA (cytosine1962-C5)-methyltransferase
MSDAKLIMFDNRLKKVLRILGKEAKQQGVSCYRLYDRDLPEFPLIIDIYEDEVYRLVFEQEDAVCFFASIERR